MRTHKRVGRGRGNPSMEGHSDDRRLRDHFGVTQCLPGRHAGKEARACALGNTNHTGEARGSNRKERGGRRHAPANVLKLCDTPALARANEKLFVAVAVRVKPGDARTKRRQRVGQEKLPAPVVERRLAVGVSAKIGTHVDEERGVRALLRLRGARQLRIRQLRIRRRRIRRRRDGRRGCTDLVHAIASYSRDGRATAITPLHHEGRAVGRAHGKRRDVVAMRHIQTADRHLANLKRHRPALEPDHRTDGLRIWRVTLEPHRDASRFRVVSENERRRVQAVDHDVKITVAIKVCRSEGVRHVVLEPESPRETCVLKREVAAIAVGHVLERQLRKLPAQPPPIEAVQSVLESLLDVGVHDVPEMPVGHEDVLPAVEIHVEEHRAPRPPARRHARVLRGLGERPITTIDVQRVPLVLELRREVTGLLRK